MTIELIEIGPFDRRRRCECCGHPTLSTPDQYEPHPWWDNTPTSCSLCEWDSRPLDADGNIRADAGSDEDRNDGLSLTLARRNFAGFASIYSPDDLPCWKGSAPSAELRHLREDLREAHLHLAEALGSSDAVERWKVVRELEDTLEQALAAQREADQSIDDDVA